MTSTATLKPQIVTRNPIPAGWWTGRTLVRYEVQHTWIALSFDDATLVVLFVEEVNVGKWFEVFPLLISTGVPDHLSHYVFDWIALPAPLRIVTAQSLWRQEWLAPADDCSQLVGAGPNFVQNVAPLGQAPAGMHVVDVVAGIALQGMNGERMLICSSDNSPFRIDLAIESGAIAKILALHTLQSGVDRA